LTTPPNSLQSDDSDRLSGYWAPFPVTTSTTGKNWDFPTSKAAANHLFRKAVMAEIQESFRISSHKHTFLPQIRYRHPKVKLPNTIFFQANCCVNLSVTEMGKRMLYSSVEEPLDSSKHGAGNKPIANTKSSILRPNLFYIKRFGH